MASTSNAAGTSKASGLAASSEGGAKGRPLNLPKGPTFRPSAEEFQDPLRFIASIREEAELYGICKIVPPPGWKPPCMVNLETLAFPTRLQLVNELQHRPDAKRIVAFYDTYGRFLATLGKDIRKWKHPVVHGTSICIILMLKAVQRRGGYEKVTEDRKWSEIAKVLQVSRHDPIAVCVRAAPLSSTSVHAASPGSLICMHNHVLDSIGVDLPATWLCCAGVILFPK